MAADLMYHTLYFFLCVKSFILLHNFDHYNKRSDALLILLVKKAQTKSTIRILISKLIIILLLLFEFILLYMCGYCMSFV